MSLRNFSARSFSLFSRRNGVKNWKSLFSLLCNECGSGARRRSIADGRSASVGRGQVLRGPPHLSGSCGGEDAAAEFMDSLDVLFK